MNIRSRIKLHSFYSNTSLVRHHHLSLSSLYFSLIFLTLLLFIAYLVLFRFSIITFIHFMFHFLYVHENIWIKKIFRNITYSKRSLQS